MFHNKTPFKLGALKNSPNLVGLRLCRKKTKHAKSPEGNLSFCLCVYFLRCIFIRLSLASVGASSKGHWSAQRGTGLLARIQSRSHYFQFAILPSSYRKTLPTELPAEASRRGDKLERGKRGEGLLTRSQGFYFSFFFLDHRVFYLRM